MINSVLSWRKLWPQSPRRGRRPSSLTPWRPSPERLPEEWQVGIDLIGCERHDYDWWLANYEECGQRNYYAPEEIAEYGAWIQLAVARQRRIEQPEAAA